METPPELAAAARERENVTITSREYDDEDVVAVDFGPLGEEPSLDVAGGTAIVVVGRSQFEFDVPPDAEEITINDGVLTIKS